MSALEVLVVVPLRGGGDSKGVSGCFWGAGNVLFL